MAKTRLLGINSRPVVNIIFDELPQEASLKNGLAQVTVCLHPLFCCNAPNIRMWSQNYNYVAIERLLIFFCYGKSWLFNKVRKSTTSTSKLSWRLKCSVGVPPQVRLMWRSKKSVRLKSTWLSIILIARMQSAWIILRSTEKRLSERTPTYNGKHPTPLASQFVRHWALSRWQMLTVSFGGYAPLD